MSRITPIPIRHLENYLRAELGNVQAQLNLAKFYYRNDEVSMADYWLTRAFNSKDFDSDHYKINLETTLLLSVDSLKTSKAFSAILKFWTNFLTSGVRAKIQVYEIAGFVRDLIIKPLDSKLLTPDVAFAILKLSYLIFGYNSPIHYFNAIKQNYRKEFAELIKLAAPILDEKLKIALQNPAGDEADKLVQIVELCAQYDKKYAKQYRTWWQEAGGHTLFSSSPLMQLLALEPEDDLSKILSSLDVKFIKDLLMDETIALNIIKHPNGIDLIHSLGINFSNARRLPLSVFLYLLQNETTWPKQIRLDSMIVKQLPKLNIDHAIKYLSWLKFDNAASIENNCIVLENFLIRFPSLFESIEKLDFEVIINENIKMLLTTHAETFWSFYKGEKLKTICKMIKGLDRHVLEDMETTEARRLIGDEGLMQLACGTRWSLTNLSIIRFPHTAEELLILLSETDLSNDADKIEQYISRIYEFIEAPKSILIIATKKFTIAYKILKRWPYSQRIPIRDELITVLGNTNLTSNDENDFIHFLYQKIVTPETILKISEKKPELALNILKLGCEQKHIELPIQIEIAKLSAEAAQFFFTQLQKEKDNEKIDENTYLEYLFKLGMGQPSVRFQCGIVFLNEYKDTAHAHELLTIVPKTDPNFSRAKFECAHIKYCIPETLDEAALDKTAEELDSISEDSEYYHPILNAAVITGVTDTHKLYKITYPEAVDKNQNLQPECLISSHSFFNKPTKAETKSTKTISIIQLEQAWNDYLKLKANKFFKYTSSETIRVYREATQLYYDDRRYTILCDYVQNKENQHRDFYKVLIKKFGADFFKADDYYQTNETQPIAAPS